MSTGFENAPGVDGWALSLEAGDTTSGVTTAEALGGNYSLLLQGQSYWRTTSSIASPDGQGYTRVRFYAKGPGRPSTQLVYQGQAAEDWTLQEYCAKIPGNWITTITPLSAQPIYIDNVTIDLVTKPQVAQWADDVYATMPARVVLPAAAARQAAIPNTMQALQEGRRLNVVMLGDSIVADTAGSPWDALVERAYPGATLNITTSVLGSTGATYYKQPGKVQQYVLQYNPDVVIIGGISNGDAESVREVVRQIQAGSSAEVILMNTAAGDSSWYPLSTNWGAPIDPAQGDYRSQLFKVASEEHVAYVDMSAAWGEYLQELDKVGLNDTVLKRDAIHDNQLGQEVLARALEAFFAPVPEPGSLGLLALGGAGLLRGRRRR